MEDTINVEELSLTHSPVSPARRVKSKMVVRLHDVFTVALNGKSHSENSIYTFPNVPNDVTFHQALTRWLMTPL